MKRFSVKKRAIAVILLCFALLMAVQVPAQAATPTCKTLYTAATGKATSSIKKKLSVKARNKSQVSKCPMILRKNRSNVADCYYAVDKKQMYRVCVVRATKASYVKSIKSTFTSQKTSTSTKAKNYPKDFNKTERSDVKKIIVGSKGNYVWYISLGSKSSSAQTALKKKI